MGSWSVYCGISQIAITEGQKCVLLPLVKSDYNDAYLPYLPATLPIFGSYDDYGGIEDIEENENTKLIEEHFKCTINELCTFLTRGIIRDDEDDFPKFLKKNNELKKYNFMFIDRKVYDFMSSHVKQGYGGRGHLDFGNKKILELLGFTYVGKTQKSEFENETNDYCKYLLNTFDRWKYTWELNGVRFYSDGTWLQHKNGSVYNFTGEEYNNLTNYVDVPEDKMWLNNKSMWELWDYLDEKYLYSLFWILGIKDTYFLMREMYDIVKKYKESSSENLDDDLVKYDESTINYKYIKNYKKFGKLICDLVSIRHNLHCMSGYFAPYILYLTPQDGEHRDHQILLDKFAEINKSYY